MRGTRDRDTVSLKNTCRCFFVENIFSLMIDFVYSVLSSLTKRRRRRRSVFRACIGCVHGWVGSGRVWSGLFEGANWDGSVGEVFDAGGVCLRECV